MAETRNSGKNKNILNLIIICVVLAVLVTGFIVIYNIFSDKPVEGEKNIEVKVVLSDASSKSFKIKTTEEFLRGALEQEKLVSGTESEYGLYIKEVNGTTADEANQEWWCITKSGEEVMTGVDMTPILDGDIFEITLKIGW